MKKLDKRAGARVGRDWGPRNLVLVGVFLGQLALGQAIAQSTSGEIYGQVSAAPGTTIKIENLGSGLKRSLTVGADGKYKVSELPAGSYKVELLKDDKLVSEQQVEVTPGFSALVDFSKSNAVALAGVTVSAKAFSPIDVTSSETSTSFSAKELQQIPVGRNIVDVAMLTPGTAAGDPYYGNLASFGGASVAENSYYINGFDVTNLFDNLNYSTLPFEAMQDEQVLTGGYGPEYGRSTGGVLSVTTKRGTNQWLSGFSVDWAPDALRSGYPDISYKNGVLVQDFSNFYQAETIANGWIGGPIIKNKLFFYGLVQKDWSGEDLNARAQDTSAGSSVLSEGTHERAPFYLGKIDYNITDKNILELTGIKDETYGNQYSFNNSYVGPGSNGINVGPYAGDDQYKRGGSVYIAKYTDAITDDLTFTGQWGRLNYKKSDVIITPDGTQETFNGKLGSSQPGCPYVTDNTDNGALNDGNAVSSACSSGNSLGLGNSGDHRIAWRGDLEYKLRGEEKLGPINLLNHDFKVGYDHDHWTSSTGQADEGGNQWVYYTVDDGSAYSGQNYAEKVIFQTLANADVFSSSYYIKDDWQIADRVILNLGVRNDSFNNKTGTGQTYVSQDNIWQPRLGIVWDALGNSKLKVFAHYGQYSLPITASVATRGASASLYSEQDYYYTGVDPITGAPTGLSPTPTGTSTFYSNPYYLNNESGVAPNPGSVADQKLKPIEESEYILGSQVQVSDHLLASVRGIYRNLDKTIDDDCDLRPVAAYSHNVYGIDIGDGTVSGTTPYSDLAIPAGVPGCFIINPGSGASLQVPLTGDPSKLYAVNLSAADIGEPKAKREYYGLEFTMEKTWAQHWYAQGSYTWAHSYGNTEGLLKSEINQIDTGTTEDFDFPEIMQGAYGNQGNDHRHTLKLFGAYKPITDVVVGANFQFQTGSPESCLGVNPNEDPYGYGNGYHYCNGQLVPQGSVGHTPDLTQLDLNFQYAPHYINGLTVSAAVFNVFDAHAALNVYEFGESASGSSYASTRYLTPYAAGAIPFQQSRYVRLSLRYEFKTKS